MQQSTYDAYAERFGVVPNQGYGLTEAAPIISMNVPGAHRKNTVGKILPGIEIRIEPVEGIAEGGRLFVKGPNIMLGYLKNDNPGVIQPPPDGWHDTGDIISLTPEGYVRITGRAKRFAKIAGEMVSLDTIETIARASTTKPESEQAAILLQSPNQPDGIALFTTDPNLKREHLVKTAQENSRSILGLPKNQDIHVIKEMPKLPTGKTDYVALKNLKETFNKKSPPPESPPPHNNQKHHPAP
jgi:acyl-[acyl-carrier-protein]-phospholipid O-acyltransferase/long-chain-fatty-acid--[acyl-carrier-protein] ligase